MQDLTFGSLFSGIGGLDLGLERAGWTCQWQVEADPYRRRVLEKHWPNVQRHGEIENVDFKTVRSVALIAGGFPCQPVSTAGKRKAQSDERWLWPEFARAIRTLRPTFALIENVTGLLQRGFGDVLSDLADCGYDAEWQMLPAVALGAPHIRQRIWLVAYTSEWRRRQQGYVEKISPLILSGRLAHTVCAAYGEPLHWRIEPPVDRMVDGLSNGMGKYIAALGDAAVPQVAEFVGRVLLLAGQLTPEM